MTEHERRCPDCGQPMIERAGQEMPCIDVEITRWYCERCSKVITNFEITTDQPLKDAEALLNDG